MSTSPWRWCSHRTVFDDERYRRVSARPIIKDIWAQEVVVVQGKPYLTAGNWARELPATIHVGYLAPAAYDVFADIDGAHDWRWARRLELRVAERLLEQAPIPCEVV